MNETFWLENPSVLFTNFCKFNPLCNGTFSYNMNAYTRLVIIVTIVLFAITKELNYVYVGLIIIVILVLVYYFLRKDKFGNIFGNENQNNYGNSVVNQQLNQEQLPRRKSDYFDTKKPVNNPAKNVQITEFDKKPEYSKSTQSDANMTKFIKGKMFQTPEQWIFDRDTIQFNTNASSSNPNDQTAFANWLYGTENNCKSGSIYANRTGTPIEAQNCTGFDISTPTNFGNLNGYIPSNE